MRASANNNTGPGVVHGKEYGMDAAAVARLRAADARRFYAENISDDVAASLRASPDFAPAFAEPGEMERRATEEESLGERGYFPIIVGFVALAAATFVFAAAAILASFVAGGNS